MVAYGENDLVKIYEKKQWVEVEAFFMHPEYDDYRVQNDIALIKLKTPLNFSDSVGPACLPASPQNHYDGLLKVKKFSSCKLFQNLFKTN